MLDLKKLALKLEEALNKETPESLNAWLATQRTDTIDNYVGEGEIMVLQDVIDVIAVKSPIVKFECSNLDDYLNAGENKYDVAA